MEFIIFSLNWEALFDEGAPANNLCVVAVCSSLFPPWNPGQGWYFFLGARLGVSLRLEGSAQMTGAVGMLIFIEGGRQ